MSESGKPPLETPDGRYIIVRGRLWRRTRPDLSEAERSAAVNELMSARRAVHSAKDNAQLKKAARQRVDGAKRQLGERGPVWWSDGAPDFNRHLARNSPYASWFEGVSATEDKPGKA